MSTEKLVKQFVDAMKSKKESTSAYDTTATVKRIDGDTAWVHIAGGVDETPIKKTINAKAGDAVQVRVGGGSAWIVGNQSAPPTDDAKAIVAENKAVIAEAKAVEALSDAERAEKEADRAKVAADEAETHAQEAKVSADNAGEYASRALGNLATVQSVAETLTWITQHGTMALTQDVALDPTHVYFVRDVNGDYTVGSYTYSIVTEPVLADISTYYELSIDESLNNYVGTHLALTNEGLWLLPASSGTNKVLIATGAGSTYTIAGTYIIGPGGELLASFRTDGLTVQTYDNNSPVDIAHLGYGSSYESGGTQNNNPYYTLGIRKKTFPDYDSTKSYWTGQVIKNPNQYLSNHYLVSIKSNPVGEFDSSCWETLYNGIGQYSMAEGIDPIASGKASHAEGEAIAKGDYSHAEGFSSVTSYGEKAKIPTAIGTGSHVEGGGTLALGVRAHAEGDSSIARASNSHAEGQSTEASGDDSHAEGTITVAGGASSHAEGYRAYAVGNYSHAQNYFTYARSDYQTAIGKYNIYDLNDEYVLIIGNGDENTRSNALTVDWNGNVEASGDITDGSGNVLSDKANKTSIQRGDIASTNVAANSYVDKTVTFSSTFSSTPTVVCGLISTSTAGAIGSLSVAANNVSATGFTCRIFNAGSSSRAPAVYWIATNL